MLNSLVMKSSPNRVTASEQGFALIMAVFVIALASILVMNFAEETLQYQRAVRNYTERIQADYVLKSGINLAKVLLEAPKQEGIKEDWLGEPWAIIASAPALPISGFAGEPRLMIVDEGGKINLNSILGESVSMYNNPFAAANPSAQNPAQTPGQSDSAAFWKNSLQELFTELGFVREQYAQDHFRTLGSVGFAAADQVAVINDWIDVDSNSQSGAGFPGEGIESSADKSWFYNRPLRTLSELPLVPGMTLERVARIAPYVRVSQSFNSRININTAPLEVLMAIGFPEAQALEIFQERTNLPYTGEMLRALVTGDAQLSRVTTVNSQEFSAYAMVRMANVTRWAHATISVQGGLARRQALITSLEFL